MSDGFCDECGLPFPECGALAVARRAAMRFLMDEEGVPGDEAKAIANRLIPSHKPPE